MVRLSRSSLSASPLATLTVAALALWGCGGGGGSEMDAGGTGGGAQTGGAGGGSKGGTSGAAGATGTGGAAGGSATGTGGAAGAGATGGTGATGGAGATGGTGATGTGGAAGGGGAGGMAMTCTPSAACALPSNVKGVCNAGGTMCVACSTDSACASAYGTGEICIDDTTCAAGNCHASADCNGQICGATTHSCAACAADADCMTGYGANYVCSGGSCAQAACQSSTDCTGGQLCNSAHQCVPCTTDTSCGSGHLCISGGCVTGTCRTGADCGSAASGGPICVVASHTCGACTDDNSCQTSYGSSDYLCGPSGSCIVGNCRAEGDCSNGQVCASNSCVDCTSDTECAGGEVCLSGGCAAGNCHLATDCTGGDAGKVCLANNCASCQVDGDCVNGYGNGHVCQGGVCVAGNCHTTSGCASSSQICSSLSCVNCGSDAECTNIGNYGPNHLCLGGVCASGNCRSTTDCAGSSQICNLNTFSCAACGADADCQDPSAYGAGHLCQQGACVVGQCRLATDCPTAGQLCDGAAFTCGGCSGDAACVTAYGKNHVCQGNLCVSGSCHLSSDCGGGALCSGVNCVACTADTQCTGDTSYGPQHVCIGGACIPGNCHDSSQCSNGQLCDAGTHSCIACASDTACQSDGNFGNGTICLAGACTVGNCHDTSTECSGGQVCGAATPHTCGACTGDGQCHTDAVYGAGDICYQGGCAPGNCHATSGDCTGANLGEICGVSATNSCGACTSDTQCKSDGFYGDAYVCNTAAGPNAGRCVTAACGTNDVSCSANGADFCCGGLCVAGNCCNNTDCVNNPAFGFGSACTNNSCSKCDTIASNTFYVDPVNGSDTAANGSGSVGGVTTPGCAFKTVTRAMTAIGAFAGTGTKVVIIGSSSGTTGLDPSDALPIIVQPNVTVTTSGGPIKITLKTTTANNAAGFQLINNGSGIAGNPAAPLTLDGVTQQAGIAIQVAPTSSTVSTTVQNVTIQNTLGDAIRVTNGTLNIGAGVVVTGSANDGLHVTGGVANIVNSSAGNAQTSFSGNTQYGIEVGSTGSINVTGVATLSGGAPTGSGTVVANTNAIAGLRINQTPGASGLLTNTITGLVTWQNTKDGARLLGGSKVKVRGSVFGGSNDGLLIQNSGTSLDVSGIDLGTASDFGKNWIQTPAGALGHNSNAGLCVNLGGTATGGPLQAAGNEMVTGSGVGSEVDCSGATSAVVTKQTNACSNGSSLSSPTATTYTIVLSNCN